MSDDARQQSRDGKASDPAGELAGNPADPPADAGRGAASAALAELVTEHHAAVYRYAYRLCGSTADAEDVTQQTFLIAQQKLDQVRDAQRVGHWLLVVARNVFLKMCRRRAPMPASGLEIDVASVPDRTSLESDGRGDDGRGGMDAIDPDRLQAAVDELPDEFRVPLLMFYFEEASYRDIAEQLDLPPGTVMSRLSRAKSHLRKRLLADEKATTKRGDNGHDTPSPSPLSARKRSTSP